MSPLQALAMLERRNVITTDPKVAAACCGWERDADGFCQHRSHHPIFVPAEAPLDRGGRPRE